MLAFSGKTPRRQAVTVPKDGCNYNNHDFQCLAQLSTKLRIGHTEQCLVPKTTECYRDVNLILCQSSAPTGLATRQTEHLLQSCPLHEAAQKLRGPGPIPPQWPVCNSLCCVCVCVLSPQRISQFGIIKIY